MVVKKIGLSLPNPRCFEHFYKIILKNYTRLAVMVAGNDYKVY